jgi:hypothetical protein
MQWKKPSEIVQGMMQELYLETSMHKWDLRIKEGWWLAGTVFIKNVMIMD